MVVVLTLVCGMADRLVAPAWLTMSDFRASISVMLVGALLGGVLAVVTSVRSLVVGAADGVLASLCFAPTLPTLAVATRRASRARPGSVIHRIDGRAPWVVLAVTCAIGSRIAVHGFAAADYFPVRIELTYTIAALSLVGSASAFVMGWRDLNALRQQLRVLDNARSERAGERTRGLGNFDFGVGEQEEILLEGDYDYREMARTPMRVLGDPRLAMRLALDSLVARGLALAFVLVLFVSSV